MIIIKLKTVTSGNTQAFLFDSFNMEIVQLCDCFLQHLQYHEFADISRQDLSLICAHIF